MQGNCAGRAGRACSRIQRAGWWPCSPALLSHAAPFLPEHLLTEHLLAPAPLHVLQPLVVVDGAQLHPGASQGDAVSKAGHAQQAVQAGGALREGEGAGRTVWAWHAKTLGS